MKVLDTSTLPPADRAEAFQTTVSANCSSSMATFEDPKAIWAQAHTFTLGRAKVLNIEASGTTLRRTPRLARASVEQSIVLALPVLSDNAMSWEREERVFGPRDLILVDLATPYVYGWRCRGASYAFHVDAADLGLPLDSVHTAAKRLSASPVYDLVRTHVLRVTAEGHRITDEAVAAQVGAATTELMRALVVSAAGDSRHRAEVRQTSLAARVQAYVQQHLREPDLTPERIAAAHNVSLRALYKVYEGLGVSLEQSIIAQRLLGARRDLEDPRRRHVTIAATARDWGFATPSHFTARFRSAFGVTPRQWQNRTVH